MGAGLPRGAWCLLGFSGSAEAAERIGALLVRTTSTDSHLTFFSFSFSARLQCLDEMATALFTRVSFTSHSLSLVRGPISTRIPLVQGRAQHQHHLERSAHCLGLSARRARHPSLRPQRYRALSHFHLPLSILADRRAAGAASIHAPVCFRRRRRRIRPKISGTRSRLHQQHQHHHHHRHHQPRIMSISPVA